MRDIGKNIRDLRIKKDLTQEELAEQLHVTRQTVSNYENGKSRPDVEMIGQIAQLLEVDVNTVFYGPPVPEEQKRSRRWLILQTVVMVLLFVFGLVIRSYLKELRSRTYLGGPYILFRLLYDPALYLYFGWWLIQTILLTLRPKPPEYRWLGKARKGIFLLLAVVSVILLPYIFYFFLSIYRYLTTDRVNMAFPYIPVYGEISNIVMYLNLYWPAVYALPGGLLRLFGFPATKRKEKTL